MHTQEKFQLIVFLDEEIKWVANEISYHFFGLSLNNYSRKITVVMR